MNSRDILILTVAMATFGLICGYALSMDVMKHQTTLSEALYRQGLDDTETAKTVSDILAKREAHK